MYRSVKHYKHKSIYSKRRGRRSGPLLLALKVIAGLLVMALLVFIGWSIEPTIQDLITGKFKPSTSGSSKPSKPSSSPSSNSSHSSTPSSSSSQTTAQNNAIRGIYLPAKALSDMPTVDTLISSAKQAGVNTALVRLKGDDGIVAYDSKITQAQGQGILVPNAPSTATLVQKLTQSGITPAAVISCFKDPVAPMTMPTASVLYAPDHAQRWLDEGRNRWLNPNNAQAQQYIIDLAKEAVSLGFKQIYLDNVEFPVNDAKAWYGDGMADRAAVLQGFVDNITKQINTAGGKVSVIMPGAATLGVGDANSGQIQNVYGFTSDFVSPNLCPSLLGLNLTVNGAAIAKPDLDPAGTINAVIAYLKGQAGTKLSNTLPLIQAYTNTAIGGGNYKEYAAADINAEIAALKSAGVTSYILYSPDGSYSLSGVSGS